MIRYFAPILLAAALATPAHAEPRSIQGFTGVRAEDHLRVEIVEGPQFSVDIAGRDARRIQTRIVEHNTLEIRDRNRPWLGDGPRLDAVIRIAMPNLEEVTVARGADLTATLSSDCRSLEAVAAMGGTAHVNGIACHSVSAVAAMGGELQLVGACGDLDVTAAMGGSVDARALQCQTVDATASMGGDIRSYASNSYDGTAAMGGSIDVAGEGRRGDTTAVMGGSVDHHATN